MKKLIFIFLFLMICFILNSQEKQYLCNNYSQLYILDSNQVLYKNDLFANTIIGNGKYYINKNKMYINFNYAKNVDTNYCVLIDKYPNPTTNIYFIFDTLNPSNSNEIYFYIYNKNNTKFGLEKDLKINNELNNLEEYGDTLDISIEYIKNRIKIISGYNYIYRIRINGSKRYLNNEVFIFKIKRNKTNKIRELIPTKKTKKKYIYLVSKLIMCNK